MMASCLKPVKILSALQRPQGVRLTDTDFYETINVKYSSTKSGILGDVQYW